MPDPAEDDRRCAPCDDPEPRRGTNESSFDACVPDEATMGNELRPDVDEVIMFEWYATTYAEAIATQTKMN